MEVTAARAGEPATRAGQTRATTGHGNWAGAFLGLRQRLHRDGQHLPGMDGGAGMDSACALLPVEQLQVGKSVGSSAPAAGKGNRPASSPICFASDHGLHQLSRVGARNSIESATLILGRDYLRDYGVVRDACVYPTLTSTTAVSGSTVPTPTAASGTTVPAPTATSGTTVPATTVASGTFGVPSSSAGASTLPGE